MASNKQVALARPTRPPVHIAQGARIPAFLNKLYEMVNDEKTTHLIQWSPSGDTFYVYDQERFSENVLPHWFKHRNFASFVRQLNMYGFHKIPHLQQGVLKSDSASSEHWNFVHPNFRRDQPDLLCLIQRKKAANTAEDENLDSANAALPTANQVLDIQSIVNGIAAIKRHQTTISAELSELKRSNELLWQESQTARQRHQKQQDTINRIVKFLAGVFGHHSGSPVHKEDVGGSPPSRAVVPRKQSRLMIEGGVVDPARIDEAESPAQFATIETPTSMASPMDPPSPKASAAVVESPAPSHSALPLDDSNTDIISTQPQYPQASNLDGLSITPSRSPTNSDFDTLIQGALSSLTPAQIQQLMNSISMPSMSDFPASMPHEDQDSSLMSYQPPLDFSQLTSFPLVPSPPQSASLLDKVDKSWRDTEDIEQDVDAVDSKINNLFQQFLPNDGSSGPLDTSALSDNQAPVSNSNTNSIDNELFHSFLNGLGDEEAMADEEENTSTAFLDEVPSASDGTTSPISTLQDQPDIHSKSARKRKSDVNSVATADSLDNAQSPGTRTKRRRER